MRHLGTVIAAVVLGPVVWLLLAFGQGRYTQHFTNLQDGKADDAARFAVPALLLGAAGLLLGVIAMLRLSPLGAVLVGLFYVATGVGPAISPGLLDLLDHKPSVAGHEIDLASPARTGTTLILGALLLVGAASVHRWRRWPQPAGEPSGSPDTPVVPADDRPLGAEGLGLAGSDRAEEPERELAWAGRTGWTGSLRGGDSGWADGSERGGDSGRTDTRERGGDSGWSASGTDDERGGYPRHLGDLSGRGLSELPRRPESSRGRS